MDSLKVEMKEWTDIRKIESFYKLLHGADQTLIQFDFSGTSFIDSVVFQLLLSIKRSYNTTKKIVFENIPECIRQDALMLGMNDLF
jgi:anti-anti-sigma regulatory factor